LERDSPKKAEADQQKVLPCSLASTARAEQEVQGKALARVKVEEEPRLKEVCRFLATGDLHVNKFRQFAYTRKDGMNSRLWYCLKVFRILEREAVSRGITKILLNGDIFDDADEIDTEVYGEVYRRLEHLHSLERDTILNLGNHDIALHSSERVVHSLQAFRKVARVITRPTQVWSCVTVVPWVPSAALLRSGVQYGAKFGHPRVLAGHVGIRGARVGRKQLSIHAKVGLEDLQPEKFDLILLSDYHLRQKVAPHVYYLGSPLQHNFGENHNACVWDITLYDRPPYYRRIAIPTNLPRFVDITVTEASQLRKGSLSGNYVRIHTPPAFMGEHAVERIAKEVGFQYQIVREAEEHSTVKVPKIVNVEKTIVQYARNTRLARLGIELYRQ